MKTKQTIITKSIARTLPIALLATSIIAGPWTAFARERSGGAGFAESEPKFESGEREHGGRASAEREHRGPQIVEHAAAPREHSREGVAEKRPDVAREEHARTNAREKTETQKIDRTEARSRIANRFAKLDERLATSTVVTENVRLHRDRITKTREYLYGLVDLGTPDWEIDAWMDALWQDEIIAGMPADLVLDYWGNPIANDSIVLAGGPAAVWTYRLQPGKTERVTVANGAVRSVRRL